MAIGSAGTNSTSILLSLFQPGSFKPLTGAAQSFVETDADIATMVSNLRDDQNINQPSPFSTGAMQGWSRNQQLYIPNRGWLKVFPGDLVCIDLVGWPILVSARSVAAGGWTNTAT